MPPENQIPNADLATLWRVVFGDPATGEVGLRRQFQMQIEEVAAVKAELVTYKNLFRGALFVLSLLGGTIGVAFATGAAKLIGGGP